MTEPYQFYSLPDRTDSIFFRVPDAWEEPESRQLSIETARRLYLELGEALSRVTAKPLTELGKEGA